MAKLSFCSHRARHLALKATLTPMALPSAISIGTAGRILRSIAGRKIKYWCCSEKEMEPFRHQARNLTLAKCLISDFVRQMRTKTVTLILLRQISNLGLFQFCLAMAKGVLLVKIFPLPLTLLASPLPMLMVTSTLTSLLAIIQAMPLIQARMLCPFYWATVKETLRLPRARLFRPGIIPAQSPQEI